MGYALNIRAGGAHYALTLSTLGAVRDKRLNVQIIRHLRTDEVLERILRTVVLELGDDLIATPLDEGPLFRGVLTYHDETALRRRLGQMREVLKTAMSSETFVASSVGPNARSQTARGLAEVLETFLRGQGLPADHLFFRRKLATIHHVLVSRLTVKEQVFFDYAIFDDMLGYEAETRAERLEANWRRAVPDDEEGWADVHYSIRAKLTAAAWEEREDLAGDAERRARAFAKIDANLRDWAKANPRSRLLRFHALADGAEVTPDDVATLTRLRIRQHPPIPTIEDKILRRNLRHALTEGPAVTETAERLVRTTVTRWAARHARDWVERVHDLCERGVGEDDLDFVLGPGLAALGLSNARDRAELQRMNQERGPNSNINPFSMAIDQRNAWTEPAVELVVARQRTAGPPGQGTGILSGATLELPMRKPMRFFWPDREFE